MAKEDFKTLYKSEFTSQSTLINEVFPGEVYQILNIIKLMESKTDDAIDLAIAWFSSNIPPYKKYFPDYDKIQAKLNNCRKLRKDWNDINHKKDFPILLKNTLYELYEEWWSAYNDSGAGIRGTVFDPQRDRKIRDAIVGNPITH